MKKASLLILLCLFLLPAAGLANSFTFVLGAGGTLTDVGLAGCAAAAPPSYPSCGAGSNLSSTNAPVGGYVGTPAPQMGNVGSLTFVTPPPLYSTAGQPGVTLSWVVTWVNGGSVQVDAGSVLAGLIGVSAGTPVFTGTFTNGDMASANFGFGIKLYTFTGGVTGTYSDAFLTWATGCTNCSEDVVAGTLTLGNSASDYFKGVGIATGSLVTSAPTPEPATLSLLGLGLLGIGGLLRRRR